LDHQGKVLLLKRHTDQHCGGLWSFPGGKIEAGESPQTAAQRELREETGLIGSSWQQLCTQPFAYADRTLYFTLFTCVCDGLAAPDTEVPHAWSEVSALPDYPMPEANASFVTALTSKFGG